MKSDGGGASSRSGSEIGGIIPLRAIRGRSGIARQFRGTAFGPKQVARSSAIFSRAALPASTDSTSQQPITVPVRPMPPQQWT